MLYLVLTEDALLLQTNVDQSINVTKTKSDVEMDHADQLKVCVQE